MWRPGGSGSGRGSGSASGSGRVLALTGPAPCVWFGPSDELIADMKCGLRLSG